MRVAGQTNADQIEAYLANAGTVDVAAPKALVLAAPGGAVATGNTGTISVTGGGLTTDDEGTFTNTGTIAVASGLTATFGGGTFDLNGGSVVGRARPSHSPTFPSTWGST